MKTFHINEARTKFNPSRHTKTEPLEVPAEEEQPHMRISHSVWIVTIDTEHQKLHQLHVQSLQKSRFALQEKKNFAVETNPQRKQIIQENFNKYVNEARQLRVAYENKLAEMHNLSKRMNGELP